MTQAQAAYWDEIADEYQDVTAISTHAFHLGPLLPCATDLGLVDPAHWREKRCLEVGSGAGQNSIFLARSGAECLAIDVSDAQLAHGRALARSEDLDVRYQLGSLEDPGVPTDHWHLVHSTYALPFAADWRQAVQNLCALVAPGGSLLLTTGHPVFAGEFLEVDDEGEGMFVKDYFNPPPDARFAEDGAMIAARQVPVAALVQAVIDCGLRITRIAEPQPIPLPNLSEPTRVPYYSDAWAELYPQLAKIPVVLTILAQK